MQQACYFWQALLFLALTPTSSATLAPSCYAVNNSLTGIALDTPKRGTV